MVKRWCVYLTALLAGLVLYAANQRWFAWLLLQSVLWLPVLSLAVSLPAILTVQMQLQCGGVVDAGTPVCLKVQLRCPLPLPLYRCTVRVTRKITGESVLLKDADPLPTKHCGSLECAPEKCWIYDYLGLFRFPIRKAQEQKLTVRPVPVQLPLMEQLDALLSRSWQPKPGGGFSENHELRLFRPGDSMNQIHWKLTAKTGKLTVREAMEPARGRILLSMELQGDAKTVDRKLGRFFWLSENLLQKGMTHEVQILTGDGLLREKIRSRQTLLQVLDRLLDSPATVKTEQQPLQQWFSWHYHIGGEPDEA